MDKTAAGLLGAVAGMAAVSSAQAATTPAAILSEALQASSYADLLKPIPNALALLNAAEGRGQPVEAPEGVQTVQGYYGYGNRYYAPYPPYLPPYGYYPPAYGYYPRYHHHHHHHHGFYDRRW